MQTKVKIVLNDKDIRRFWKLVDKRDDDECWIYKGKKDIYGYGKFILNIIYDNKAAIASRVSWVIHFGGIPEGMLVLHHCDNPSCVNPKHLFLGTNKDNARDKIIKGRCNCVYGENHWFAKLKELDVIDIKTKYKNKEATQAELARLYHVKPVTINHIICGRSWNHVEV